MQVCKVNDISYPTFWISVVEKYLVDELLREAQNPNTDFLPAPVWWNTSIPQIIDGLSMSGKLSTVQGMPPILAQIYINTLLTIDLTFLPLWIVPVSTT